MTPTKIVATGAFSLLIGYGSIEALPLISGPELDVRSPAAFATIPSGTTRVSGHSKRIVALSINGATVLPHADGTFAETLTLPKGESIITLEASDRFGRTVRTTRTVSVP